MHSSIHYCNQNDTNCPNFVFTSHQLHFQLASIHIDSDVVTCNLVVIVINIVDRITFILFDMVISDRNQ